MCCAVEQSCEMWCQQVFPVCVVRQVNSAQDVYELRAEGCVQICIGWKPIPTWEVWHNFYSNRHVDYPWIFIFECLWMCPPGQWQLLRTQWLAVFSLKRCKLSIITLFFHFPCAPHKISQLLLLTFSPWTQTLQLHPVAEKSSTYTCTSNHTIYLNESLH